MVTNILLTTCAYALLWQTTFISTSSDLSSKIIPYLGKLCPKSNVCAEKRPGVELRSTSPPCCTECSCADDCHETYNCCFNHGYPLTTCVSAVIPQIPLNKRGGVNSGYYMITQPPPTGCISYREFQATRLGNVYPVSSAGTYYIYVNESMAECHGVMDGVKWTVEMSCKREFGQPNIVEFIESLDQPNVKSSCRLIFQRPKGIEHNNYQSCAPYSFDTSNVCLTASFKVPNNLNLTHHDYRELCKSDFYSLTRYKETNVYKNAFCLVCAGKFRENSQCQATGNVEVTTPSFFGILDPSFLQTPSKASLETRHANEHYVCLKKDDCRLLHCPSFQQRLDNGTCIPQWGTIRLTFITIAFKLIPQSSFFIQNLYVEGKEPTKWLDSPWSSPWRITRVYREEGDSTDDSLYVFVTAFESAEMAMFLRNTYNTLNEHWNLSFQNETIKLRQQIGGFYIKKKSKPRVTYITKTDGVVTRRLVQEYQYDHWEEYRYIKYPTTFFTRLHFCQQVELEPHEYLIDEEEMLIYNRTGAHFLKTEYARNPTTEGEFIPRICMEDLKISGTDSLFAKSFVELEPHEYLIDEKEMLIYNRTGAHFFKTEYARNPTAEGGFIPRICMEDLNISGTDGLFAKSFVSDIICFIWFVCLIIERLLNP